MKHLFKRKEEKFILSLLQANNLKSIAKQGLNYSHFNKDGSLTDIRTTYMENDDFLVYHMKKEREKVRYKIRIREYGKEGRFKPNVWIELKEKCFGQGYKNRFKISRQKVDQFISGEDITEHILEKNSGIEEDFLYALYERVVELIKQNNLYPRLVMQYQRLALQEDDDEGIRLTFDYNLKGGMLQKGEKLFSAIEKPEYFDKYKSIIELKIEGDYPEVANEIKRRLKIEKLRFSKFVFGLESFIEEFPPYQKKKLPTYKPFYEIFDSSKENFV